MNDTLYIFFTDQKPMKHLASIGISNPIGNFNISVIQRQRPRIQLTKRPYGHLITEEDMKMANAVGWNGNLPKALMRIDGDDIRYFSDMVGVATHISTQLRDFIEDRLI